MLKAQDIDAFLDGPSIEIDDEPISEIPIPKAPKARVVSRAQEPVSSDAALVKMPDMEEIKIKNISNSGRSLIVDRGSLEGLKVGQLARLYLNQTESEDGKTYPYVAEAEIVKVHRNYSFWILRDIEQRSVIKPGQRLLALRRERPFGVSYKNRHVQRVALENDSDELTSEREGEYQAVEELVETPPLRDHDMQTQTQTTWKSQGEEFDEGYRQERPVFFTGPAVPPGNLEPLKSEHEKAMWRYTAQSSVDKVNRLPLGLKHYYNDFLGRPENQSAGETHSFSQQSLGPDQYGRYGMALEAIEQIESEGLDFSADMEDSELRRFLVRSGIKAELERQKQAFFKKSGPNVNLSYFSSLTAHTTSEDEDQQGFGSSFALGFEYPLGNSVAALGNYSLQGGIFLGSNFYDVGGVNALFGEQSLGFYGRWYFRNSPNFIKHFMPYAGLGWRWGTSSIADADFDVVPETLNYVFIALPSIHLGVKYRFQAGDEEWNRTGLGLGVDFQMQYEKMSFENIEVPSEEIYTQFETNHLSLGFGVNIYF